ncbi:MAG: DUF2807 domain-containing protein [Muribaculaceae bacterium]|nr:DUF2807 domain-containing protein [Muribaculaceae bacterium]
MNIIPKLTIATLLASTCILAGCSNTYFKDGLTINLGDVANDTDNIAENDAAITKYPTVAINKSFNTVAAYNAVTVEYVAGDTRSYTLSCRPDIKEKVSIKVKGNSLCISFNNKQRRLSKSPKIHVVVTSPDVERFEISNASTLIVNRELNVETLKVESNNASNIQFNYPIRTSSASIESNNASSIQFNKPITASSASIESNNASNLIIKGLTAANINGSSANCSALEISGIDGGDLKFESSNMSSAQLSGTVDNSSISKNHMSSVDTSNLKTR